MNKRLAWGTMLTVILVSMLALTTCINMVNAVTDPDYPADYKSPDINSDGKIEGKDITIWAKYFGSTNETVGRWNPLTDLNNSNSTDGLDLAIIAKYFGKIWP